MARRVAGVWMVNADQLLATAWQARREGRLKDAERDLERAIEACRRAGDRLGRVRALGALAHVARDRGQPEHARSLCEEAVAACREEEDPLLLAHAIRHLGDVHRECDRLAEAALCMEEALALFREAPEPAPLAHANALRSAAIVEELRGETGAARRLWSEARLLYETADVDDGVEECEGRLVRLGGD